MLGFMMIIPKVALAVKFQPELAAEVDRVKAIYTQDLKLDTNEFCGITKERTDYFNTKEKHLEACKRFRNRIASELQCLNNTKQTLKKDMFPRISFSYFIDNEGWSCFTDSSVNSNQNNYGIKSEQASEDMYKAISRYLKLIN